MTTLEGWKGLKIATLLLLFSKTDLMQKYVQYLTGKVFNFNTVYKDLSLALCSRNIQNVKLRLDILSPLRFYVKLNFGEFKQSKNVIFGNKDTELIIFGNFGTWNLLKFTEIKIQNL